MSIRRCVYLHCVCLGMFICFWLHHLWQFLRSVKYFLSTQVHSVFYPVLGVGTCDFLSHLCKCCDQRFLLPQFPPPSFQQEKYREIWSPTLSKAQLCMPPRTNAASQAKMERGVSKQMMCMPYPHTGGGEQRMRHSTVWPDAFSKSYGAKIFLRTLVYLINVGYG